jgi:hypothetical protein
MMKRAMICFLIVTHGLRLCAGNFLIPAVNDPFSVAVTDKTRAPFQNHQVTNGSLELVIGLSPGETVPKDTTNFMHLLEKQFRDNGAARTFDSLAMLARSGKLVIRSVRVSYSEDDYKSGGSNSGTSSFIQDEKEQTNVTTGITPVYRILNGYSYKISQQQSWYTAFIKATPFRKLSLKGGYLSFFEQMPLEIKLLFFLALFAFFFLFNIASVALVVVISNVEINRRKAWYVKQRQYVIEVLSPLLIGESELKADEQEQIENSLRSYTSHRERQVIIDVLLEARRNLTGNAASVLFILYDHLQLDKVSISSTRSVDLYRRIMGIRELAFLGSNTYSSVLTPYLNSRNPNVRTEAILAYILLDKQSPLGFLDYLHHPFVRWIQLSAYYTMYFNGVQPPILRRFLSHHDPQVVLWSLRLISIYNQLDTTRDVSRCLTSPDPKIRQVAIQTSLSLENWKVKEMLKKRYQDEPLPVKLEILKVVNYFADSSDTPFLKILINSGTFIEVREAVRILYNMGENSRKELTELDSSMSGTLTRYINHVAEPKNAIAL